MTIGENFPVEFEKSREDETIKTRKIIVFSSITNTVINLDTGYMISKVPENEIEKAIKIVKIIHKYMKKLQIVITPVGMITAGVKIKEYNGEKFIKIDNKYVLPYNDALISTTDFETFKIEIGRIKYSVKTLEEAKTIYPIVKKLSTNKKMLINERKLYLKMKRINIMCDIEIDGKEIILHEVPTTKGIFTIKLNPEEFYYALLQNPQKYAIKTHLIIKTKTQITKISSKSSKIIYFVGRKKYTIEKDQNGNYIIWPGNKKVRGEVEL